MVLKWLPSCGTPSRITSDLDMKKTELDFNPYIYSLGPAELSSPPGMTLIFSLQEREVR